MPFIQLARRSCVKRRPAFHQQKIKQTAAFVFDAVCPGSGIPVFKCCSTPRPSYVGVEIDLAIESVEGVAGVAGERFKDGVVGTVLGLPVRGEGGEDVVVEGAGGEAETEEGSIGEIETYFVQELEREVGERHGMWLEEQPETMVQTGANREGRWVSDDGIIIIADKVRERQWGRGVTRHLIATHYTLHLNVLFQLQDSLSPIKSITSLQSEWHHTQTWRSAAPSRVLKR
jgi:hypothetical protein